MRAKEMARREGASNKNMVENSMEIKNQEKERLHLLYIGDEPVMQMESEGVKMTLHFASEPPINNAKQEVINVLTNSYGRKCENKE